MNLRLVRRVIATAALALAACGTNPVNEAREQFQQGRGEEALALLDKAAKENPADRALRNEYFRMRELLVAQWLAQAETVRVAGQFETAEAIYQRIQQLDAANPRARAGLAQIETDKRHRALIAAADKLFKDEKFREAQAALRPLLAENPQQREARRLQRQIEEKLLVPPIAATRLKPLSAKPISVEMRDVTLRALFDVLQTASGVNFVFDKDVRADQKTSIALREATFEDTVQLILVTNQLAHKVVNERTALVFPHTPQKLREYQELVVKSFVSVR